MTFSRRRIEFLRIYSKSGDSHCSLISNHLTQKVVHSNVIKWSFQTTQFHEGMNHGTLKRRLGNHQRTAEWKAVHAQAMKVPALEKRIAALEAKLMGGGTVCDKCGSSAVTRIGSRPNATFGDVGVKDALYRCNICDAETAVLINP